MCLSVPQKVNQVDGEIAFVGKMNRKVNVALLGGVKRGDYVLTNADLAIRKLNSNEVREVDNTY